MTAFELMQYLATHAVASVAAFGIVREDESVLAFGTGEGETKVRLGSVTYNEDEGYYLVLQWPDSQEEYRAKNHADVAWFIWKLIQVGNWPDAVDWAQQKDAANVPLFMALN